MRGGGCGTGLREGRAALLFQAVNPQGRHFRSFDLLLKALSRLLDCHSYDNAVIIQMSKVIETCLNHGILLSFKDANSTPNVWERGVLKYL